MGNAAVKKIKSDIKSSIMDVLKTGMSNLVDDIIDIIMNEYDDKLIGIVTDRNSKSNPSLYREEFLERLQKFNFLEIESNTSVSFSVPTMYTFDFSGRLKVLETVMHGVAGLYVELAEDEFVLVFGKKPINQNPIDEYVPVSDRIYLVKYNSTVIRAEKTLNKKFVRYPFSNMPPIEIFPAAEKYLDTNKEILTNSVNKAITDVLVTKHRGVVK